MHLRCRLTKNSPRRTTSTPAGVFCTLLASASSISKGLRRVCFTICCYCKQSSTYQNRHGRRWFYAAACLRSKHVGKKCTGRTFFTVPAGVFCALLASASSISKGLRRRAFFRTDRDVRGSTQKRRFCFAKTRVQKCTRMYTSGQSISKGLRQKDCSEPPWRAVVSSRSEFACELVAHECTGRTFVGEDVRGSTQ